MFEEKFWQNKKIFITGHTGFKGSWLCLWLSALGAKVTGYALQPPTEPSLYELCKVHTLIESNIADIRNYDLLRNAMRAVQPEIVIHMAAQPIVQESYRDPVYTYAVNVMGTVNVLESVRKCESVKAVINVTTDKCYENKEWVWGYRENEMLGGYDPYSNSKACSELVTSAYRSSFFNRQDYGIHGIGLATARAGNVIGGGDWAPGRIVPDCVRALLRGEKIMIRNPSAIRPWQHVLEPLSGYLLLAQRLYEEGPRFAEAWNFGPCDDEVKSVQWIVKMLCAKWGNNVSYSIEKKEHGHEANYLKLDCNKAKIQLLWKPRWNIEKTIDKIVEWTLAYRENRELSAVCLQQIDEYMMTKC